MADVLTDLRQTAERGLHNARNRLVSEYTGGGRVLMMLGQYMFSIASAVPQSARHHAKYRWPTQEVVGGEPVLQFLGPSDATIELPGRIYPHYRGGLRQVRDMREIAGLGDAQLLVDALGVIYGDFAIVEIEETQSVFDANNAPRRIDFRLKLHRVSA